MALAASQPPKRLSTIFIGQANADGHWEYIFRVWHASGLSWQVRRRYSDLLAEHTCLNPATPGLPQFPPKGVPGLGLLLGKDFLMQRALALQQYFQSVLAQDHLVALPGVQRMLGVQPPGALGSVRVLRWSPGSSPFTVSAELEIALAEPLPGRPVEGLAASAFVDEAAAPLVEVRGPPGRPLLLSGLPTGRQLRILVRARNGVGSSEPLALTLRAPGEALPQLELVPGMRVRAVWAGNGGTYDATVHRVGAESVVVNWLRPAPLSSEVLHCVIDAGGDDTDHRTVPLHLVKPLNQALPFCRPDTAAADAGALLGLDAVPGRRGRVSPGAVKCGAGCFMAVERRAPSPSSTRASDESADEQGEGTSDEASTFSLGIQLDGGKTVFLEWHNEEDLRQRASAFSAVHRLKPIFCKPVLTKAKEMMAQGRKSLRIDVVDLL